MVFEAVRAVEVAAQRGADGKRHRIGERTGSPAHGLERGPLVVIRDDPAFGEALDYRMVLVKLLQYREQIQLDRRVLGAVAAEQVRDGRVFRVRHRRAQVVTRHMPAGFARRARLFGLLGCGILRLHGLHGRSFRFCLAAHPRPPCPLYGPSARFVPGNCDGRGPLRFRLPHEQAAGRGKLPHLFQQLRRGVVERHARAVLRDLQ